MKKIIIVVLVIGALLAIYFLGGKSEVMPDESTPAVTAGNPDASNGTFIFEEDRVKLTKGKAEIEIEGSSLVEEVTLTGEQSYGDLNMDDKNDAVVTIARLGGGSGVFIYVAAYVSGPAGYNGTNAVYLGDRIEPQSIKIDNGIATVMYLDRKEGEPFAAEPTVPVTKTFIYTSGELRER
jgi:hypothetical protein